jgi:hypothetical protein
VPFQKGNRLGQKAKLFVKEINKAFERDRELLPRIVKKFLDCCEAGEPWAVQELANRLDGKAHQTVDVGIEHTVQTGDAASLTELLEAAARARTNPTVQ